MIYRVPEKDEKFLDSLNNYQAFEMDRVPIKCARKCVHTLVHLNTIWTKQNVMGKY
jgi:hypothetical protein